MLGLAQSGDDDTAARVKIECSKELQTEIKGLPLLVADEGVSVHQVFRQRHLHRDEPQVQKVLLSRQTTVYLLLLK